MAPHRSVAPIVDEAEVDLLSIATVQHNLTVFRGQGLQWRIDGEIVVAGERGEHLEVIEVAPVPSSNGAFSKRQARVGNDPVLVKKLFDTQAVATATCAGRAVEREQARFQLTDAVSTDRAGEAR